jgi:hypothetical protein
MQAIIGVLFCLLLGIMVKAQGWLALLWFPLGFAIGLFVTAQMVLPIMLGLPRAIRLVSRGEMRSAVYARLLAKPVVWIVVLLVIPFLIGFFWPSVAAWVPDNAALNVGTWLGIVAILLSPLSKKSRDDFRADFDRSYGRFYTWFRRKPTQQKYVQAAITVATNLYLHTIPGAENPLVPVPLKFSLPDSRFRYLMFCLSTAITAALVYDEKKEVQPEALINGCLHFATWAGTEMAQDYFDDPASSQDSINNATAFLQEFLSHWSRWPELEKERKSTEITDLICCMIHIAESDEPATQTEQRLGPLALDIQCRLPAMQSAFVELANR